MPVEFRMPKLGLTMEEGKIIEWLVDDGDLVESGASVLMVETDKVETEVAAPDAGRLHRVGNAGDRFACGELIGWLLAEGEGAPQRAGAGGATGAPAAAAVANGSAPAGTNGAAGRAASTNGAGSIAPSARLLASPNARRVAAAAGIDVRLVAGTGPGGRIVSEDVEEVVAAGRQPVAPVAAPAVAPAAIRATYAAHTLANLLGVDIGSVAPSTAGGEIDRQDVARYVRALLAGSATASPGVAPAVEGAAGAAAVSGALSPPVAPLLQEPTGIIPLTGMRGTIASRMHASLRDSAQLTMTMDADMGEVVADRARRLAAHTGDRVPGYTDYVVSAAARALRAHPVVNSQVTDRGIALLPRVHVGMAVATAKGLYVPVVRDADTLDLETLSAETGRLAEAARAGSLRLEDLEGATFSVSALGMYGVDVFTPVINPPNAAILGVGRMRDDVAWDDAGNPRRVKRMTLSLTWDHRVFDGAPAAEFCRAIVGLLEAPRR